MKHSELTEASYRARDELIVFLMEAISELRESEKPALEQLPEFAALTACASRLFGWQVAASKQQLLVPDANSVVNLNLIQTPPEKLAQLALARGLVPAPEPVDPKD